jgi:hypothetical protein
MGLGVIGKRWLKKPQLLSIVFLGLSLPTSFVLLVSAIQRSMNPSLPVFRPVREVKVFEWLKENTEPGSVVLSSFTTGNALPAWAPVRVVLGHGPETANLATLGPMVTDFYSGAMKEFEMTELIRSEGISYIFYGPLERIPAGFDLAELDLFELRFDAGDYQLFEIQ